MPIQALPRFSAFHVVSSAPTNDMTSDEHSHAYRNEQRIAFTQRHPNTMAENFDYIDPKQGLTFHGFATDDSIYLNGSSIEPGQDATITQFLNRLHEINGSFQPLSSTPNILTQVAPSIQTLYTQFTQAAFDKAQQSGTAIKHFTTKA